MSPIRVLIVDDSVTVRHLLWKVFREDKIFDVVGMLSNGQQALEKLPELRPDVVTLDIEMPVRDGLDTLQAMRRIAPRLPVIILSSHSEAGALVTLEALARGAVDCVAKPAHVDSPEAGLDYIRKELLPRVKAVCSKTLGLSMPDLVPHADVPAPPKRHLVQRSAVIDILAIGSSVGGPNCLAAILPELGKDFPLPVVIAQHMPAMFTRLMAERFAAATGMEVREGVDRAILKPGHVWIAPGHAHMMLERVGSNVQLKIINSEIPNVNCRPSVDVLFRSVANVYGARSLAVVLSGMGNDGLLGCEAVSDQGGQIMVQDRESSVVWGMPGFVANAGLAEAQLPLDQLRTAIVRKAWMGRTRPHS